jgi:ferritin-like protein
MKLTDSYSLTCNDLDHELERKLLDKIGVNIDEILDERLLRQIDEQLVSNLYMNILHKIKGISNERN